MINAPLSFLMPKILGLDISSASTGYCVVDNGKLIRSAIGIIVPKSKDLLAAKLVYFEECLTSLMDLHKPDFVVIEDIFKGQNAKTFKTLAMFRGICFSTVYKLINKEPICIMPTEARKIVGANGSKKEDGFAFVINKYSFKDYEFDSHNDITDSIVLALACHIAIKNGIKIGPHRRKRKKKS